MTKKLMKSKTSRQSCRQKYKINRKVKEHNRKEKRQLKKQPSRKTKDPGIPNSIPFKSEILAEALQYKANAQEEKRIQQQQRKLAKIQSKQKITLESLVKDAEKRGKLHESGVTKKGQASPIDNSDNSAKAFHRDFCKVVNSADVILQVLDARDPIGTRCIQVEETVLSYPNKRLVMILNKIDLVPKDIVTQWITYLRKSFPAIAFKCSTQDQRDKIGQTSVPIRYLDEKSTKSAKALGAGNLMKLLNNYCRNNGAKTSICVGVVGLPNTGKSSLINSLKRTRACFVGAVPGVTRALQEVQLDKHIRLIDSPGVVMASSAMSDTQLILKNCTRIDGVQDPLPAVSSILSRCHRDKLMVYYNVPSFNTPEQFLCHLARRMGRLKKGGILDTCGAGRKVLHDWVQGNITYYTLPPADISEDHYRTGDHLTLVNKWSKEFSLDEFEPSAGTEGLVKQFDVLNDHVIQSDGPVVMRDENEMDEDIDEEDLSDEEEEEDSDEDEEMESEEEDDGLVVDMEEKKPQKKSQKSVVASSTLARKMDNNDMKKAFKVHQKKNKKADKLAGTLGSEFEDKMETVLSEFMNDSDDDINDVQYEFTKYFPKKAS